MQIELVEGDGKSNFCKAVVNLTLETPVYFPVVGWLGPGANHKIDGGSGKLVYFHHRYGLGENLLIPAENLPDSILDKLHVRTVGNADREFNTPALNVGVIDDGTAPYQFV